MNANRGSVVRSPSESSALSFGRDTGSRDPMVTCRPGDRLMGRCIVARRRFLASEHPSTFRRAMNRFANIGLAGGALIVLVASACGSTQKGAPQAKLSSLTTVSTSGSCRHFTLSLAIDHGQSSAVAAAVWFANGHNGLTGWELPVSGWTLVPGSPTEVRSGTITLHVMQLSDKTWAVASGEKC